MSAGSAKTLGYSPISGNFFFNHSHLKGTVRPFFAQNLSVFSNPSCILFKSHYQGQKCKQNTVLDICSVPPIGQFMYQAKLLFSFPYRRSLTYCSKGSYHCSPQTSVSPNPDYYFILQLCTLWKLFYIDQNPLEKYLFCFINRPDDILF